MDGFARVNRAPDKRRFEPKWTLAASVLASSLAFVDGSVTNVALRLQE